MGVGKENEFLALDFAALAQQVDDWWLRVSSGHSAAAGHDELYGVLAYLVLQRQKEIGIRMASGTVIIGLILRHVAVIFFAGIAQNQNVLGGDARAGFGLQARRDAASGRDRCVFEAAAASACAARHAC